MSRLLPGRRASASGPSILKKTTNGKAPLPPLPPSLPPHHFEKVASEPITLPAAESSITKSIGASESFHNEMVKKLLSASFVKLENALPCNSGNMLENIEADIPTERMRLGLVQSSVHSADVVLMELCDFLYRTQKRIPADGSRAKEFLESELYILKTMSQALDLRWPSEATTPNAPPSTSTNTNGDHNGKASENKDSRGPSPKTSNASLRSTSTGISWLEPKALDDETAERILDVIHKYLVDEGQFGTFGNELFPWKVPEWVPALAKPTKIKRSSKDTEYKAPKELRQLKNSLVFDAIKDLGIYAEHTVYTHEETRDETLHGSFLLSVPVLVRKFAARIVYHLSASNWHVVFGRVSARIQSLIQENGLRPSSASGSSLPSSREGSKTLRSVLSVDSKGTTFTSPTKDEFSSWAGSLVLERPKELDLRILSLCLIDKSRLASVLNEYLNAFRSVSLATQETAALVLHEVILNWVEDFPQEFSELWTAYAYGIPSFPGIYGVGPEEELNGASNTRRARTPYEYKRRIMDGLPERLFDMLRDYCKENSKRAPTFYPVLAVLLAISPERLESAHNVADGAAKVTRKDNFLTVLEHALVPASWGIIRGKPNLGHTPEQAAYAYLDLINLSFILHSYLPNEDFVLHSLGESMAQDLKGFLLNLPALKTPFYLSSEPIDVNFCAYAIAAIYRFLPGHTVHDLLKPCVEIERSHAAKLVAVKALIILNTEISKYPRQPTLDDTVLTLASNLRKVLGGLNLKQPYVVDGLVQRPAATPICKSLARALASKDLTRANAIDERVRVFMALSTLVCYDMRFYINDMPAESYRQITSNFKSQLLDDNDSQDRIILAMSLGLTFKQLIRISPDTPNYDFIVKYLEMSTPVRLRMASSLLLGIWKNRDAARMGLRGLNTVLEELVYGPFDEIEESRDWRFSDNILNELLVAEIALLNSLSCSDMTFTRRVLQTLRLLCVLKRHPSMPAPDYCSRIDNLKRYSFFEAMCTLPPTVGGQAAFHKRIRKYIQLSSIATPVRSIMLRLLLERFLKLTAKIRIVLAESHQPTQFDLGGDFNRDELQEWRNLMFSVLSAIRLDVDPEGDHFLPDVEDIFPKFTPLSKAAAIDIIKRFMTDIVSLLDANNVSVREAAKEALGTELNIRALPVFFESFDSHIRRRLTDAKKDPTNSSLLTFLEQALITLGMIFDRLDGSIPVFENNVAENLTGIGLLLNQISPTDTSTLRLRLRFCTTVTTLLKKRMCIAIGEENTFRGHICDLVADWLNQKLEADSSRMDLQKLIQEARMATLKVIVTAVEYLQLKTEDVERARESSRRINHYIETLLSSLPETLVQNISDSASNFDFMSEKTEGTFINEALVQELVITALAHILTQNSEIAKGFCIAKCYDDNFRIRVLFMKVFTRVLNLGAKFDKPKATILTKEHEDFAKMIRDTQALSTSILRACSSEEEEELTPILLRVFNDRQSLLNFLKLVVDLELSETGSAAQVLRSNNIRIRILSLFLRNHGYHYLRKMVNALIGILKRYCAADESLEIESSRLSPGEDVSANIGRVMAVTHEFIGILAASYQEIPSIIREMGRYIGNAAALTWPGSRYRALAAFFFLRFLAPTIVAPVVINIVITDDTGNLRRGLVGVARVLQSIANRSYATKKDNVSGELTSFMENQDPVITGFLTRILEMEQINSGNEVADAELYPGCDEGDSLILRKFVDTHSDKIGNDFIDGKVPEKEFIAWKDTWDAMLLDSRTAMERPKAPSENANQHTSFQNFMKRTRHRYPSAYRDIFHVTSTPYGVVVIIFFAKISSDVVDFDFLLYSLFKTLIPVLNSDYDVIFDFTGFTSKSRIPISWLKRALELLPADFQARWRSAYLMNTSAAAQAYLREVFSIFSGLVIARQCSAPSSVEELRGLFPAAKFLPEGSLLSSSEWEEECFDSIHHLVEGRAWKLGSVYVGGSYARIVSEKPRRLSSTISTHTVEVIDFHEVEDIHKSQDKNSVILRFYRGFSMTFETEDAEELWKSLTEAKQRSTANDKTPLLPATKTSDTSATLLAIGLLHCCHAIEFIRGAAYDLLAANCAYLGYPFDEYIPWRGNFIPANLLAYISTLCDRLSKHAPQLTLDFILEWYNGFVNASHAQKLIAIQYLRPWVRNLDRFSDPQAPGYNLTKLQECVYIFVDISMQESEVYPILQKTLWIEVSLLTSTTILDILFGKLSRIALDHGLGTFKCDQVGDIMLLLSSMHIRTRIITELRNALTTACNKETKSIMDVEEWPSITVLTRLALTSAHHPRVMTLTQISVPEIAFMVVMLAGLGTVTMRLSVYGIACNLVQALLLARQGDDTATMPLRRLSEEMNTRDTIKLFELDRPYPSAEIGTIEVIARTFAIDAIQKISELMVRIMDAGANSAGILNVWRARWTSLMTTVMFKPSPFAQSRGFVTMAVLMKPIAKVESDFFRELLKRFARMVPKMDEDREPFMALLRCIRHAVPGLQGPRDLFALTFWAAVSILQAGPTVVYDEILLLIEVVISAMDERGYFPTIFAFGQVLLESRQPVHEIASAIDNLSALSFDSDCGFALTSSIWNGVKNRQDVASLRRTITCLMSISVRKANPSGERVPCLDPVSLPFFLGLGPAMDRHAHLKTLQNCHVDVHDVENDEEEYPIRLEMLGIKSEKTAFLAVNLLKATEDYLALHSSEQENLHCLWWLLAEKYPEMFASTIWHTIVLARDDWLRNKLTSYFGATTPAHLKAVTSVANIVYANAQHAMGTPESTPNASLTSLVAPGSTSSSQTPFTNISAIHGRTAHGQQLNEYSMSGIMELYRRAHKPNQEGDAALRREILRNVKLMIEVALAQIKS